MNRLAALGPLGFENVDRIEEQKRGLARAVRPHPVCLCALEFRSLSATKWSSASKRL
jgi:hypothetical protein